MGTRTLFLAGMSALEVWTASATGHAPSPTPTRAVSLRDCATSLTDICAFDVGRLGVDSRSLDVLVPPDGGNRATLSVRRRRAARTYPQHSFFRVADHVLACCPELCFVQLAREFSLVDLVLFGYEICGSFAIDRQRESLVARRALTTAQRLHAYAQVAGAVPGAAKARMASSLVLNGSRSPMESKVAFELSAPRHLGGFGLPAPVLNKPLSFTRPDGTIERLLGIRLRSRTSDLEGRRLKLHQSLYPKVDRAPRPAVARHDLPWR